MMNWHIVTSDVYTNGTKVAEDLYFLSDTHEIYRGEVPFTESVVMFNGDLPATAIARNRLYIKSTDLSGYTYDGTQWTTVINPVATEVLDGGTTAVSGAAVVAYVAAEIAKVAASKDTVSVLDWDSAEHILTATMADKSTKQTITFDGLGVKLNYVPTTGALTLIDAADNQLGEVINLPLEHFVSSGVYDAESEKIILYFDEGQTRYVEIPVGDLVDMYEGAQTSSITVSTDKTNNTISADVRISSEGGNTLEIGSDGLYVIPTDLSDYMLLDTDAVEGNIATFGTGGQVVDSGTKLSDLVASAAATLYQGASIEEALNGATPKNGDICVVLTTINGDKVQRTAYFYQNSAWTAMDGNVNAENVYFADDLLTTAAVGNITLTDGQATIAAAGKNLKEVFNSIFVKEQNPTITQPSVSLTASLNRAYEIGEVVSPTYSARLNTGSYQYGPSPTGVSLEGWTVTDTAGNTMTAESGTLPAVTVTTGIRYTITATASHSAGNIPRTNVGNEYSAGAIAAGQKSATSAAITGYRRGFYGTMTSKDEVTAEVIRALAGKTSSAPAAGNTWTVTIPIGAMRTVIAYPGTLRDVTAIIDVNGMQTDIKSDFTKIVVQVPGANNAEPIEYKVFYNNFANPNDVANTYRVTI